ncbi:uncharacterized protein LOC128148187 [Harpia harpyja]|uniref:uncharacterized protein LOC128148187 n=1 Tax=Harpia harpyja TaxID=202280 RepID=UPI0022B0F2A5|nr:uncharacterized protein LOC128148187 [Harpia harpyja]
MPGLGEPALVVEKLLYGLIIFLVNNCLERLTHLSFGDGSHPALPWLDRNPSTVRNLPLRGAFLPSKSCLCVSQLWLGNGLRTCSQAPREDTRPTRAGLGVAHGLPPAASGGEEQQELEDDLVTACKYSRGKCYLPKSGTESWRQKLDSFQEGSLAGLEQGWAGWVLLRSLLYCCFLKGAAVGLRESPRSGEWPGTGHEEGLRGTGAPQNGHKCRGVAGKKGEAADGAKITRGGTSPRSSADAVVLGKVKFSVFPSNETWKGGGGGGGKEPQIGCDGC